MNRKRAAKRLGHSIGLRHVVGQNLHWPSGYQGSSFRILYMIISRAKVPLPFQPPPPFVIFASPPDCFPTLSQPGSSRPALVFRVREDVKKGRRIHGQDAGMIEVGFFVACGFGMKHTQRLTVETKTAVTGRSPCGLECSWKNFNQQQYLVT